MRTKFTFQKAQNTLQKLAGRTKCEMKHTGREHTQIFTINISTSRTHEERLSLPSPRCRKEEIVSWPVQHLL